MWQLHRGVGCEFMQEAWQRVHRFQMQILLQRGFFLLLGKHAFLRGCQTDEQTRPESLALSASVTD